MRCTAAERRICSASTIALCASSASLAQLARSASNLESTLWSSACNASQRCSCFRNVNLGASLSRSSFATFSRSAATSGSRCWQEASKSWRSRPHWASRCRWRSSASRCCRSKRSCSTWHCKSSSFKPSTRPIAVSTSRIKATSRSRQLCRCTSASLLAVSSWLRVASWSAVSFRSSSSASAASSRSRSAFSSSSNCTRASILRWACSAALC
mmetsp:Transcript_59877/g.128471  ORF Transcript_59877/g.128471 Transcript_59877/m.128471 type:complete len:212 (-) Transcript_59877:1046-1681(-)